MEVARGAPPPPQRPRVPTGYRFAPTPEELISGYLDPWVAGRTPCPELQGIVCVADVYSADPDTLTSHFRHFGHDDGSWYFLCVSRWKGSKAGTRMNRCVHSGGTWHGSGRRRPVGAGAGAGHRQSLEYRDADGTKTAWLMDEYGSALAAATGDDGVKVICKVHRSARAAAAEEELQDQTDEVGSKRRTLRRENGFAADMAASASAPAAAECSDAAGTSHAAPATLGWWPCYGFASANETDVMMAAPTTTWPQPMTGSTGYGGGSVHGDCVYFMNEPEPFAGVHGDGVHVKNEPEPYAGVHGDGVHVKNDPEPFAGVHGNGVYVKNEPEPFAGVHGDGVYVKNEPEPFAGVHGDAVHVKNEPEPLEMAGGAMGWPQFTQMAGGFVVTAEEAVKQSEWIDQTLSNLNPSDGVDEDDTAASG